MENKKAMDMIDRLRGMFPEKMEAIDYLEAELMADEEMPEAPADEMDMEADQSEDASMEMDDMDMGMEDEEAPMPKKKKPEDEEDEEDDMFA